MRRGDHIAETRPRIETRRANLIVRPSQVTQCTATYGFIAYAINAGIGIS